MTKTTTTLGLLGAGRLGQVMSTVWLSSANANLLVWSRSGPKPSNSENQRIAGGTWVGAWSDVLSADAVLVAISGKALFELVEDPGETQAFTGRLYNAAVGVPHRVLERIFPRAAIVRIAPFLIDGTRSVPMLAFRSHNLSDAVWSEIEADLSKFGVIDTVGDERAFECLTLMGSPWPAVMNAVVNKAAGVTSRTLDEESSKLGRRLFLRGLESFISRSLEPTNISKAPTDSIATPGGLTARGLENVDTFGELAQNTFAQMLTRSDEIRADTLEVSMHYSGALESKEK